MENMASTDGNKQTSKTIQSTEQLVDRFLDAIWMERGLSQNTLGAYRADLMTLGRGLAEQNKSIGEADKAEHHRPGRDLRLIGGLHVRMVGGIDDRRASDATGQVQSL